MNNPGSPSIEIKQHLSILNCIDTNGQINVEKYIQYCDQMDEEDKVILEEEEATTTLPKKDRNRSCKRKDHGKVCDDGTIYNGLSTDSTWYMNYVNTPKVSCDDFQKEFRLRFRIPFVMFQELTIALKSNDMFKRWCGTDCTGSPSSIIELLILGALRTLGRDLKLDDIREYSGIAVETHRQFFHVFILYGSTTLYNKYIKVPTTKAEMMTHLQYYANKGLHGAVGSMDATHIASKRIPNSLIQLHKGYKLPQPSRAYNATVSHNRQILHSTHGYPARWNDKSIVQHDELYNAIKSHNIGDDVEFQLYYYDVVSQKVCVQKYCGVWLIVDNGYLDESCTVPPFKDPIYVDQFVWSEWMESVRKDVECTFGNLKVRFLIFNSPVRYHGVEIIDQIWLTCCALHNMLLFYDDDTCDGEGNRDGSNANDNIDLPDPETYNITYPTHIPTEFADDAQHDDPSYRNGCGKTIPIKALKLKRFVVVLYDILLSAKLMV